MKHADIITKLTLEQKCALLSGESVFTTRGYKNAGIPSITLSDGPNGVRKQAGAADHLGLNPSVPATCFPTAATVACSWDPALGEQLGRAMGEEAAAQEVSVLLGPGLNTKRSPLCGRNFEYFSEDPYLSGKLAAAYVRGIQSNGIAACPKHFAVNSQELRRMASDSVVDERTLRELYLTGFEIVVKEAHPKTIMSSYNFVNGTYANENAHLLQDILRRDWGFDGAVVTDWGGSNDHALGVKNGSTLEMPAPGGDAVRELLKAVETGKISESDVDARLDELLTLVLDTHAAVENHSRSFDADAHHALARRAAAESAVLLKNDGDLLPLAAGASVAVIGDFAETPRYQGAGSSAVNSIKVDAFLDCLKDSGLHSVGFAAGFDRQGKPDDAKKDEAVALAKKADTVLLCLGLDEIKESEGLDRADMKLADNQIELLQAVQQANPNTVVIVSAGASLETPWLAHCRALVYGALGGQAGAGAMVDVLTGKINPSGKLAETWANAHADTPAKDNFAGAGRTVQYCEGLYVGYRYYQTAGVPVAFPFGYGLSSKQVKNEMAKHYETSDNNKPYSAYVVKIEPVAYGREFSALNKNADNNISPCSSLGKGWRLPTHREYTMFASRYDSETKCLTRTYFSFGTQGEKGDQTGENKVGFVFNGHMGLCKTNADNKGSVRCVRDIDQDEYTKFGFK